MRRNSILRLALVLLMVLALHASPAAAQGDPRAFMTDMGNHLLRIINDRSTPEAQRRADFQTLGESAFDIPRIAQFSLGRYWRAATDDQKQRFIKAFEIYMVAVYWSHFSSYSGESFKVTGAQDEGNGTTDVTTDILRPDANQPPVKLTWQLVKSGDSYKIRDADLEGISQAQTYRDEFSSILERNGGDVSALIAQLVDRAKSGAG
jgi:phospholipid transport system substrate-binding protein